MSKIWTLGLRMLLVCTGLAVAMPLCAQTIFVQCTAVASHGISVSHPVIRLHEQGTDVEVSALRPRTRRILPTQTLEFAIIGADGSVRAKQHRTLGPAQMPRKHSGPVLILATLSAVPVADRASMQSIKS